MNIDNSFVVLKNENLKQAMEAISANQKGAVLVSDDSGVIIGILSDGDIRRAILRESTLLTPVEKILNTNFFFCSADTENMAAEIFSNNPGITILPILSKDNKLVKVLTRS